MTSPRVKEIDFELEDPILHHKKGESSEITSILIKSPTAKQRKDAFALKQMFTRAMMKQQDNLSAEQIKAATERQKTEQKDVEIEPKEIVMMMLASSENFETFNETFKSLLVSGAAEIDGEKFTQFHYDQLSLDDAERLLGEYLKVFLVSSLLQK